MVNFKNKKGMVLTEKGLEVEKFESRVKRGLTRDLLSGIENVASCTRVVCCDAVAYVVHLRNLLISFHEIKRKSGEEWTGIFPKRKEWMGEQIVGV